MENKFNWEDNILRTSFGRNKEEIYRFKVGQESVNAVSIEVYENDTDLSPLVYINFSGDSDMAKNIIENTVEYFTNKNHFTFSDIGEYLSESIDQLYSKQSPASGHQLETAQNLSEETIKKMQKFGHSFIIEYEIDGEEFVDDIHLRAGELIDHKSLETKYGAYYKISEPIFEPSDLHYRLLNIQDEIDQRKVQKKTAQEAVQENISVSARQLETAQKDNLKLPDPEKSLDWSKNLSEQSEYVKKAIEPLLTAEFAIDKYNYNGDKDFWEKIYKEDPNRAKELTLKNSTVFDLFHSLTKNDDDNRQDVFIEYLKLIGIEGGFDSKEFDEWTLYADNEEEYSASKHHRFKNMDVDFRVKTDRERDKTKISCSKMPYDGRWHYYQVNGGPDNAKNIVDNAIKKFNNVRIDTNDLDLYFNTSVDIKDDNLHSQLAKKAGYVQGVCESILAFNTDENRKIMSEATLTFLSKKLLSEMNVTKDMAQKFAHPNTYKALEKCLFTQKQEQQLEQTQVQGRRI